ILSGTGTDGTLGLRAIKDESGLTIAQEPSSAKYQGMPRSAIAAGVVDVVKPAGQMSEPLLAYTRSLTRPARPFPEHEGSATLRLWVAGCSTGEEAYSLAILIREYLTQQKRRLIVQIFASDLDSRAIETARLGLYPVGIAGDVTPDRLHRFFTKEDHSYRVK